MRSHCRHSRREIKTRIVIHEILGCANEEAGTRARDSRLSNENTNCNPWQPGVWYSGKCQIQVEFIEAKPTVIVGVGSLTLWSSALSRSLRCCLLVLQVAHSLPRWFSSPHLAPWSSLQVSVDIESSLLMSTSPRWATLQKTLGRKSFLRNVLPAGLWWGPEGDKPARARPLQLPWLWQTGDGPKFCSTLIPSVRSICNRSKTKQKHRKRK